MSIHISQNEEEIKPCKFDAKNNNNKNEEIF